MLFQSQANRTKILLASFIRALCYDLIFEFDFGLARTYSMQIIENNCVYRFVFETPSNPELNQVL